MSADALQFRWNKAAGGRDPSFWALFLLGLGLLISVFGFDLAETLDLEWLASPAAMRLYLGFTVIYVAFLVSDLRRLRQRHMVLMEAMLVAFRDPMTPRRDREAVELLIPALSSDQADTRKAAGRELRRLTGQTFGDEPKPWKVWWHRERDSFLGRRPASSEASDQGDADAQ